MFCKCPKPFSVKSEANGQSFSVCSKNLGGCGREITTYIGIDPATEPEICEECEGAGMWMVCYGGLPTERKCEYCNGEGYINV